MVANRQERGCGRQHRECSRVDRISGRTNGRRKRTKSGSNTSVVPVSYSCRTKVVQAVLDRQRSGVKATIWWFCHDHDRSGRSAMIGNIGKEWSAQCDLGFTLGTYKRCGLKFGMLVYPCHLQNWLDYGHGLFIFLIYGQIYLVKLVRFGVSGHFPEAYVWHVVSGSVLLIAL